MTNGFGSHLYSSHLFGAVLTGFALHRAMPPLNTLGMVIVGAGWPVSMFCAASGLDCSAMPPEGSWLANAMFTFSEPTP